MVRQVDMKGGYGYMPAVNGVKIGAWHVIQAWFLTPEPKVFPSARIGFVNNFPVERAFSLTCNHRLQHMIAWTAWYIDVQECVRG